ncbi:MAG: VanZ family protein [Bacillota bacterium]
MLKNFMLIVIALMVSQFFMYYFIDDVIVMFVNSPVPYIIGRFLLGFTIFVSLKFLLKEFEIDSIFVDLAMILYFILVGSITLYKGNIRSSDYNFIPFNFLNYVSEVNLSISIPAISINLLLLVPLAVYLRIKNIKFALTWKIILSTSLMIELLQFFTMRGTFDVDDLLLNTIGGCLGYFSANLVHNQIAKAKPSNSSGAST